MSVFTREAFTMSAMPTPAASAAPSRRGSSSLLAPSGTVTPAAEPHIAEINVSSVLFDMDGTLIKSSGAVVKAWELFAEKYPLDLPKILRTAHGMRTVDVLKKWCKIEEQAVLEAEVIRFETAILNAARELAEKDGEAGIEVLPGVEKLLADLGAEADSKRNGEEKWAICTSSTLFYAGKAIPIAGLPTPKVFVTADSVKRGKPFPDPYLLGAELCKASPFESIVVEDAPTGIRAGKASGALVLATCTSHERAELEKEHPDFLVEDLSHVQAAWDDESKTFRLIIEQPINRKTPRPTPENTPLVTPAVSRANSLSGLSRPTYRASDELTGNDSVFGTPSGSRAGSRAGSRSGSPTRRTSFGADKAPAPQQTGFTLESFRRALAGNAQKEKRVGELDRDD